MFIATLWLSGVAAAAPEAQLPQSTSQAPVSDAPALVLGAAADGVYEIPDPSGAPLLLRADHDVAFSVVAPVLGNAGAQGHSRLAFVVQGPAGEAIAPFSLPAIEPPIPVDELPEMPPLRLALAITDEQLLLLGAVDVDPDGLRCSAQPCADVEDYPWAALKDALAGIKLSHPDETGIILVPESTVTVDHIVRAMDTARGSESVPLFPSVTIAGPMIGLPQVMGKRGLGVAGPIILGELTKEELDPVIKDEMSSIRSCYSTELAERPTLSGQHVVKFVVGANGRVNTATKKSSALDAPNMDACINRVFLDMQFPEPKGGGIVIVSYPFMFSPG